MQLFDNSFATITYHQDGHYIEFEYKRFGTSAEFRQAWTEAGSFAAKHKVTCWLNNSIKAAVIKPEDQRWFTEELSQEIRKGTRGKDVRVAILLNENVFTKVSVNNIVSGLKTRKEGEGKMIVQYYKEISPAREWLIGESES